MQILRDARPFSIEGALRPTGNGKFDRLLEAALEKVLYLQRLNRLYQALPAELDPDTFLQRSLDTFGMRYAVGGEGLEAIPREGPLLIVANHPFGALEGVIMAHMLRRVRPDVRIMANYLLKKVPEVSDLFIAVDPFGGEGARQRNVRPLKECVNWLRGGGVLVVFPAGEVAHLDLLRGVVADPPWSETIARIARRAGVPVQPIFFGGGNSALFHLLGLLHPRLRTALLPREFVNKSHATIDVRVGRVIPPARFKGLGDAETIRYLRLRTYLLGRQGANLREMSDKAQEALLAVRPMAPIDPPVDPELLRREIEALPERRLLLESGECRVYYAKAKHVPAVVREIGRLREVTFRETGEGTGRASDTDLFDSYYTHLFVWNHKDGQIVGAYRLAKADKVLEKLGKRGLYTHTLFHYRRRLLRQINPAIELGRSFVRKEYQRSYSSLLLLWKGIGQYLARNPDYCVLFGPVSISADYQTVSQQMLVDFLRLNNFRPELARMVRPRRPFRDKAARVWRTEGPVQVFRGLDDLSDLLSAVERDGKGVPVLLRQYLKLGGKLLGFNVDDQFSDVLDGLIMVDLRETDPKVLGKYMGQEAAREFLARHAVAEGAA